MVFPSALPPQPCAPAPLCCVLRGLTVRLCLSLFDADCSGGREAAVRSDRFGSEAARPGRGRWWRAVLATAATIALAAGMTAPAAAQGSGGRAPAASAASP